MKRKGPEPKRIDQSLGEKIEATEGCWEWIGAKHPKGYGLFAVQRRNVPAHRYILRFLGVHIPSGYVVCHTCDNPSCVRPSHLLVGTHTDNHADRESKGRGRGGFSSPRIEYYRQKQQEWIKRASKGRNFLLEDRTIFAIVRKFQNIA